MKVVEWPSFKDEFRVDEGVEGSIPFETLLVTWLRPKLVVDLVVVHSANCVLNECLFTTLMHVFFELVIADVPVREI